MYIDQYAAAGPRRRPPADWRKQLESVIERALALLDEADRDPDFEPSLAAPEVNMPIGRWLPERNACGSQVRWGEGGSLDLEDDPAEMGIADAGGLCEQTRGEGGLV